VIRPPGDDHAMPALMFLAAFIFVGLFVEVCSPSEPEPSWYERYVEDNCKRCELEGNECCVYIDATR
tara:strand:- start:123 stop:323 length:201 start_codon:yes stop_codon:yes gene_type:complete